MKIVDNPNFSSEDFYARWEKCRFSSLTASGVLFSPSDEESFILNTIAETLPESLQKEVLKSVFDFSRVFGLSFSKHFGVSLEIHDFADILTKTTHPCFFNSWKEHNSSLVLERKGCGVKNSFVCDYWREALDGLVMGASDEARLARHKSAGHGDEQCLDILFTEGDTLSASAIDYQKLFKYGEIPHFLRHSLENIEQDLKKINLLPIIEGLNEGTLFYKLEARKGVLCGDTSLRGHEIFQKQLLEKFPDLKFKDVTPLAVYGGAE